LPESASMLLRPSFRALALCLQRTEALRPDLTILGPYAHLLTGLQADNQVAFTDSMELVDEAKRQNCHIREWKNGWLITSMFPPE